METSFAISPDGLRIAYDICGSGEAIVLLHGGLHTRRHWHDGGYVERLKRDFTVITIDIRGNGESDKPLDSACYATEAHCRDILATTAACGLEKFMIWGYSYGGNIGRYLAAQSSCVSKFVMTGFTFGPGASGPFRRFIAGFRDHWLPILEAQKAGTLNIQALSTKDRETLQRGEAPVVLSWLSAILDWTAIEPGDLLCPTLWLAGSRNDDVMSDMKEREGTLSGTNVISEVVEGLNHWQEFSEIDRILPTITAFLTK